jgi:hypothetical protein
VGYRPPRPAASSEPAHWLTDRINLWGQHWVTNLVGSGFQAYARLLHPLDDHPGAPTWAEVARANGRTMHASVQWDAIRSSGPLNPDNAQRFQQGRSQPGDPMPGRLNTWALEELCTILAGHTATPRTCCFAVWQGCGLDRTPVAMISYAPGSPRVPPRPAPAEWQLDLSGPTFSLPHRNDYYLFEGHVSEAVRIGRWINESWFSHQTPHFFWPADHAWCVATEITEDSTIIGGSSELVDALCASEDIEVLQIPRDAPHEDHLNL